MSKQILAAYDDEGVFVYQAFKPSFGWMLHRSEYATAVRQERILKIKLRHDGFLTILRRGVPTSYDRNRFASEHKWRRALDETDVRIQWDPDRSLRRVKLERRAIQLGMGGETVRQYVQEWMSDSKT
jgi:hypothetical protein